MRGRTARPLAILVAVVLLVGACAADGFTATSPDAATIVPGSTSPAGTSVAGGTGSPPAPVPTVTTRPTRPPPSATPPPPPPPPPPGTVTHDPRKFGFAAKGMTNEVMAFLTSGQIRYALDEMDWDAISTISWFSLEATSSGAIRDDGAWRVWNSTRNTALIEKAHATGTKVVISLERFSWSSSQIAATRKLLGSREARERLARTVVAEVVRRGVDGVNVDFEPIPVGQKANFTHFIRTVRRALDAQGPGYQLTFDITGYHSSYDVAALVGPDAADAVYLMGYHYAGTWSKIAGSNAPMGGPRYDVIDTVRSLLKLVERHEIIVGVPYYGHVWPTAGSALGSRTLGGGHDVLYSNAVTTARLQGVLYDPVQQVAVSRWRARPCATCSLRWYQMYFDDVRASAYKWAWIKRNKLLGTGMWTIGFEGGAGALNAELRRIYLLPT